jgi:hypothetical protein
MTGNDHLADQLRREADDCMQRRKVLLTCSVALAQTRSVAAARKVISDWDGPAAIKAAAIELLGELETTTLNERHATP